MLKNTDHVLVNTVDSIKSKYTVNVYTDTRKSQAIQNTIDHPSTNDYIKNVQKK